MNEDDEAPEGYKYGWTPVAGYPQAGVTILVCVHCGAAVGDPDLHDGSHRGVVDPPPVAIGPADPELIELETRYDRGVG